MRAKGKVYGLLIGEPTQKAPSLSRAGIALPNDVSLSLSPKLRKSYVEATRSSHDALDATATLPVRNMPASTAPPTKVNNNTHLSGANETGANLVGSLHQSNKTEEDGWIEVRRRRKLRFKGRKGTATIDSNSKFKAADLKIPLFIYNVSPETSADDVAEYIMSKTQIKVQPEKIKMKNAKEYDSYKFYIPKHKLSMFDDDTLWPEGIYFRRYIIFKSRGQEDTDSQPTVTQ